MLFLVSLYFVFGCTQFLSQHVDAGVDEVGGLLVLLVFVGDTAFVISGDDAVKDGFGIFGIRRYHIQRYDMSLFVDDLAHNVGVEILCRCVVARNVDASGIFLSFREGFGLRYCEKSQRSFHRVRQCHIFRLGDSFPSDFRSDVRCAVFVDRYFEVDGSLEGINHSGRRNQFERMVGICRFGVENVFPCGI